ncbi:MAG: hypothetical protein BroJett018_39640 [Chloroflexota bacterium]|nr:MAG: hypothetical protein BroJett018_39640 [Chloroflexota bacterium]
MESTSTATLTLEDFMQRYSDEGPFELIDGAFIPVTAQVLKTVRITFSLARKLADFVDAQKLGEVFVEAPFVLVYGSNWVKGSRIPDIMFYRADRVAQFEDNDPDAEDKPLIGPPDLAVEIVSPTDRMIDVTRKVRLYLEDGVQLVWVVEPDEKSVSIFTPNTKQFTRLTIEDTLSGGDILPNFALPLEQLFE